MHLVLSGIALLTLGSHFAYISACQFPQNLRTDPKNPEDVWFARPKLNEPYLVARFNETAAIIHTMSPTSKESKPAYEVTCLKQYNTGGNQQFRISFKNRKSGKTNYTCIKFHPWSGNVIQILSAKLTSNQNLNCTNQKYGVLPYPMIANLPKERKYIPCPVLPDGYKVNFTVFSEQHPKGMGLCKNTLLETECMFGEGLQFNFKDITCVPPQTGWATDQTLYCLASIDDDTISEDYSFSILTVPGYKPRWCMRWPRKTREMFVAEIFMDLICPVEFQEKTTNFLRLELSKADKPPSYNQVPCKFDAHTVSPGNYTHQIDTNLLVPAKIDNTSLDIHLVGRFECSKPVDANTYMLTSEPSNSCRRRYTCGRFAKAGPMVQLAKLGQSQLLANQHQVCADSNFQDDPFPVGDLIRSRDWKVLINDDDLTPWDGCRDIHTVLHANGTTGSGSPCSGDLSTCNTESGFSADWNCSQNGDYYCLGALVRNVPLSIQLFTAFYAPNSSEYSFNCWVYEGDTTYLLPTSQCNSGTVNKIRRGWLTPLAQFHYINETEGCANSTSITTVTPTTQRPTGLSTGTVIGIVVGSLVGVAALIVLLCLIRKHSRNGSRHHLLDEF